MKEAHTTSSRGILLNTLGRTALPSEGDGAVWLPTPHVPPESGGSLTRRDGRGMGIGAQSLPSLGKKARTLPCE